METIQMEQALIEASMETLEKMTFVESELISSFVPGNDFQASDVFNDNGSTLLWCGISIRLPENRNFYLVLPEKLAQRLTRLMLGIEEKKIVAISQMVDSVSELTNVLTGRICRLIYGEDTLYDLGVPEYGRGIPKINLKNSFIVVQSSENEKYLAILSI